MPSLRNIGLVGTDLTRATLTGADFIDARLNGRINGRSSPTPGSTGQICTVLRA
ncbi:pentapeptide repeat-containing protein [Streptomyces sp. NPDC021622]|uniref:pentapeptide repeat-containing protein n=1 Tax=Streptomyces sp. NPDC021622 TaxID=3155013 RepID=UPI0033F2393A